MNRMKDIIAIAIMMMLSVPAYSAPNDGDNLYVYTKGAAQAATYSLDNLDKMTFGDNALSLWTNSGKTDYAYNQIELLTFRSGIKPPTGIKNPIFNSKSVRWMYDRTLQSLRVTSEQEMSGITVFDAQGRVVIKKHISAKDFQLPLDNVPSGVYVVKVSESKGIVTTIKIIK